MRRVILPVIKFCECGEYRRLGTLSNLICGEISLRHQNWNGTVDPDQWETKFDTSFDTTTLGKLILTRPLNRPFISLGALICKSYYQCARYEEITALAEHRFLRYFLECRYSLALPHLLLCAKRSHRLWQKRQIGWDSV